MNVDDARSPASWIADEMISFTPGIEWPPTTTCTSVAGSYVNSLDWIPVSSPSRNTTHGAAGAVPNQSAPRKSGLFGSATFERSMSTPLSANCMNVRAMPWKMLPPVPVAPHQPDLSTMS